MSEAFAFVLALIWARFCHPNIRSRPVLNIEAQRYLREYGPAQLERSVAVIRKSEEDKWTGVLHRERPGMTKPEAIIAGKERAAKENPWLYATAAIEIDPDVPPGPYELAPRHHVGPGGDPRTRSTRAAETPDERQNRIHRAAIDAVKLASPTLTGPAYHAEVYRMGREIDRRERLPKARGGK